MGEAAYLFEEIFVDRVYLRHGLRLPDGGCVLDVGANIGMFALFACSVSSPELVLSFEPVPPVYAALRRNTAHLPAVRPLNVAVGRRCGRRELSYYPGATVMSTTTPDPADELSRYRSNLAAVHPDWDDDALDFFTERALAHPVRYDCPVTSVDRVLAVHRIAEVDLLKIDVEKSELDVLGGIGDHTWPRIRQVVADVHDIGDHITTTLAVLDRHGFRTAWEHAAGGALVFGSRP